MVVMKSGKVKIMKIVEIVGWKLNKIIERWKSAKDEKLQISVSLETEQ